MSVGDILPFNIPGLFDDQPVGTATETSPGHYSVKFFDSDLGQAAMKFLQTPDRCSADDISIFHNPKNEG